MLETIKTQVQSISSFELKLDNLLTLKPEVEKLKEVVGGFQLSLDALSKKYDSLVCDAKVRDTAVDALTERVASLEGCVSSRASIILRQQSDRNDTQQYSGSSNLEIHGLPTSPDENLGVFLSDLSQKLKIPSFSPNQVSAIHRLPKRKNGPATVLVRFTSKEVRDRWLAARSKLRDLTNSGDQTPLYFSENLNRSNRELFFSSRAVAKEHNIQFVWVKNGRIYLGRRKVNRPFEFISSQILNG
ncbi:hypothetical protein HPB48_019441 [Haemaphysalis longicornis]|uniref:FP protein C-terminal domain-containing protein n=1 Tax=Haemaphysalis longicornis TaxID=44386 RepID=A0A9J6FER7_HAELO|nr:hypothetical protein HPB48_019441 [Haemaphysalis longicornis]